MWIFDKFREIVKEFLISIITKNLEAMFTDINERIGTIATDVGKSPLDWNSDIFHLVEGIANTVIVPIAGLIITYVLCYELITMILEKNNMHEFETFVFFKFILKAFIAMYLVSHSMDIAMAIFDVSKYVVNHTVDKITGDTNINIQDSIQMLIVSLQSMDEGGLFIMMVETIILSWVMKIMYVAITVVLYGRMLEIYLYISVAPIPFATMTNKEWGGIGNNYVRGLFAFAFQGFFMLVCVAAYSILVKVLSDSISVDDVTLVGPITVAAVNLALLNMMAISSVLCLLLLKSGHIAQSIFGSH